MARVYVKRSGKKLDEAVMKAHGFEVKEEEKKVTLQPVICKICGNQNGASSKFCNRCGRPLTPKALIEETNIKNVKEDMESYKLELKKMLYEELQRIKGSAQH